ncbi:MULTISPECIES: hypothetical protein [unclassified Pseudodesulfovibrio]|uniref:hypothetical protein n=1 Tax=unclassified Pseudodesulfovibrio TaxID=2661612 RepID=UPI000FEBE651|nr:MULTISPECIES: hypothetical protein [unclassified Pseudodesulfovibrio]MCJ2163565.1 hypothetical protein [Pseudodesulfovibrio sp. S3-i]RWU06801.1 hypothetical protein DWB63_03280 [Pseudodesulfovibrio sp. S3]
MLQIISGKFYTNDDRYKHDGKGILFSNYSCVGPIETCIATLEPVGTYGSSSSYVVSYINQLEKHSPPQAGTLVRTGDSEIVEQFMYLCNLYFRSFFHKDKATVWMHCREHKDDSSDQNVPSHFVPRIFDRQINGTNDEAEGFIEFIDRVIGLPREDYLLIMDAIRNYSSAIQAINSNIDLAYSQMIYSLESLAQRSDNYVPIWADYPENPRKRVDKILSMVNEDTAGDIQEALLKDANLKARKRFIEFILDNVSDSYFIEQAPQGYGAVRKNELKRALSNAYTMRSKFVHELKPIQDQLRHPRLSEGDVFRYSKEPYFSIAGLIRLFRHVALNLIESRPQIEHEEINWRKDLPGIVHMEMAPEYWIWKTENINCNTIAQKLTGFLSHLETLFSSSKPITDLRPLLNEYEKKLDKSDCDSQKAMLTTYFLYNNIVNEDGKSDNHKEILKKYDDSFDDCCIESMVVRMILNAPWPWHVDECVGCWNEYQQKKYWKGKIQVPQRMTIGILVTIAAKFLENGHKDSFKEWMSEAVLEAAGKQEIQKTIQQAIDKDTSLAGIRLIVPDQASSKDSDEKGQ